MTLDEFMKANVIPNSEAARHVGVTREMVRRYRERNAMPSDRIKARFRIWSQDAVVDWPPTKPRTK